MVYTEQTTTQMRRKLRYHTGHVSITKEGQIAASEHMETGIERPHSRRYFRLGPQLCPMWQSPCSEAVRKPQTEDKTINNLPFPSEL